MVGATASLNAKDLVAERRRIVKDTREDALSWLRKQGFPPVPSDSNCFMLDVRRPGQEFIRAMAAKKVYIGRVWPIWPNHVRVTVGTPEEMARFKQAFSSVA
jgi:histidinol-phosphate/aromatic aminotransferase/cobyric acid decarboxylase-like protein